MIPVFQKINNQLTRVEKDAKIYAAGHRGMVGSAILRALQKAGYTNSFASVPQRINLR